MVLLCNRWVLIGDVHNGKDISDSKSEKPPAFICVTSVCWLLEVLRVAELCEITKKLPLFRSFWYLGVAFHICAFLVTPIINKKTIMAEGANCYRQHLCTRALWDCEGVTAWSSFAWREVFVCNIQQVLCADLLSVLASPPHWLSVEVLILKTKPYQNSVFCIGVKSWGLFVRNQSGVWIWICCPQFGWMWRLGLDQGMGQCASNLNKWLICTVSSCVCKVYFML